jgi:hypothetical protein
MNFFWFPAPGDFSGLLQRRQHKTHNMPKVIIITTNIAELAGKPNVLVPLSGSYVTPLH